MGHVYNLRHQAPDTRDFKLARFEEEKIPSCVDHRDLCPPVFDQGELGSCTANAGIAARMMLTGISAPLSRLFLYYQERVIEGTAYQDSGAEMRDICKALTDAGVCEEKYFPYNTARFAKKPSCIAARNAMKYKIGSYATFDGDKIDDVKQIKQYLALRGPSVLIGIDVYESFEGDDVARTGVMSMPDVSKEQLLGGHAVLIVGYDDSKETLIVRNSWGESWGDKGCFYMPYNYVEKGYAFDSWTISI